VHTILLLIAAVAGAVQAQQVAHPSKPAPSVYVTTAFGLAVQVPEGLSICPLPKKWSGSEDGTVLFLKPADCLQNSGSGSSTRLTLGFAPSITLRYRANSGRTDHFDGDIPPARSPVELASQSCAKPEISPQFKLFGQPAVTCRSELPGGKVRVVLMALYGSRKNVLLVSLLTTQERLPADERVLESVAAAITGCKVASDNKEDVPVCPKGTAW
jgi:hypothetical protein